MIIQISNIVAGFLLAAPKLKEFGAHQHISKAESKLNTWRTIIGTVSLIIGLIAFLDRIGIISYIPNLGSSYPQSIPAILMGLTLNSGKFEKYPALKKLLAFLGAHAILLGFIGMLVAVWSLLFGCNLAVVCTMLINLL